MDLEHSSIPYASISEVQAGRGAELVNVEDDVLDVVRRLKEIHPGLNVTWNPYQEYFTVYELCEDGRERIVTNVTELDPRLIAHFEMLASDDWDPVKEMDRMDDEAEENQKKVFAEQVGEIGERLHHALASDYEFKHRIFVP